MVEGRHALLVGCGYLGEAVADRLHTDGWTVMAWTASAESAARLAARKAYAVEARDITDRAAIPVPSMAPGVVIDCVSSGRGGAEEYRRVYLAGARHLLAAFPNARLVFTGSSSVYAQTDGSWVDEASPTEPARDTGRVLLETEAIVLAAGGMVARLSGIYGPGRASLLERYLAGNALIEGDGGRWLNHIHRDDAATALLALLAPGIPAGIYNVTDNYPVTQIALYEALADHFGRPLPPAGAIDLNRKRGWTSKRVDNRRLRTTTGWQPRYPSYVEWTKMKKQMTNGE